MGRYHFNTKQEADGLSKLSTSFLNKHNYFVGGWRSGTVTWTRSGIWGESKNSIGVRTTIDGNTGTLQLTYTITRENDEKQDFDYPVELTTTPCNFGGHRWWFICPLVKAGVPCGRRVGTLYRAGDYFGCRHCYELTYESRNQNHRYAHKPLFDVLALEGKMEELREQIKRPYYNGKPTKKYRKLLGMYQQMDNSYEQFRKLKL